MNYTNIDHIRALTKEARLDKVRIPDIVRGIGSIIQSEAKRGQDSIVIAPNQDSELGKMLFKHDREPLDQVVEQLRAHGYDVKLLQVLGKTSSNSIFPVMSLSISWTDYSE